MAGWSPLPQAEGISWEALGSWLRRQSLSAQQLQTGTLAAGISIQSSDFVSGTSGWQIDGDGNAEFNDITVRGTIYATDGEIGNLEITEDLYLNDAYILFRPKTLTADLEYFGIAPDGKLISYSYLHGLGTTLVTGQITPVDGVVDFNYAQVLLKLGGEAAPSFSFGLDPDTGMYRYGTNVLGFATGGSVTATLDGTGLKVNNIQTLGGGTMNLILSTTYWGSNNGSWNVVDYGDRFEVRNGPIRAKNGAGSGYSFYGDEDTYIDSPGADVMRMVVGASEMLYVYGSGLIVGGRNTGDVYIAENGQYSFWGDTDTYMYRYTSGGFAFRGDNSVTFVISPNGYIYNYGNRMYWGSTSSNDWLEFNDSINQIQVYSDGSLLYLGGAGSWTGGGDNLRGLGSSGFRWTDVWAVDTSINSSDPRLKDDLKPKLPIDAKLFVSQVEPHSWRWKDGKRLHVGFNAAQVKRVMDLHGVDWGAYIDPKISPSPEDEYAISEGLITLENLPLSLRQGELVPVLWQAVRELIVEVEGQNARIQRLEDEVLILREYLEGKKG